MGKRYVMFVDERGFLTDKDENFTMVGVIFECNYCSDSKYYECELRMKLNEYKKKIFNSSSIIPLDDMILKENVYRGTDKQARGKFINELPSLFKGLKFSIISSTVKIDMKDSYSRASKKLLKEFYTYVMKKNGQSGGIILESKLDNSSYIKQQRFFDIYYERNMNLNILGDVSEKICSFIVCEKSNKTFGAGIEVLNIINNIIFRVSNGHKEFDSKLISYMEYGNRNKMFDLIKRKIYRDTEIRIGQDKLIYNSYDNEFSQELIDLKEQLICKNIIIDEKEKEIKKLIYQIELLNQKLEKALFVGETDAVASKILSDLNVKIQGLDKITTVAKS